MEIRDAQLETLAANQMRRFVDGMVIHLRDDFRSERQRHGVSDTCLPDLVRSGIEDAARYGVTYEDDVQLYLECLAMLGPEFDRDPTIPWAGEILRADYLDGETKMSEIHEHLLFNLEWPLA